MEIVLATRNRKKIEEIKRITEGMPVSIYTLDDFPGCPEVEEDGVTFEENAVKKALAIAKCTGKHALADDSGLEVFALDGAPGVMSSRYAGDKADDKKNIEKLLNEMRPVKKDKRQARFVCCIALASPQGYIKTFYGYIQGIIGTEPKGSRGFGYDPIFYPESYKRTFAEMSNDEKDAISHRGRASMELKKYLETKMKD
ncbi:MAG: XTP/dITP diphosphatase [Nitrospirae bacterium]|jgi:XTP/dITP diphosphohydrolase|nr:XTP/dITP diphosphatase [Nitrospirota bacterium]